MSVLFALVLVLTMVIAHTVSRAVPEEPQTPPATPAATPTAAAAPIEAADEPPEAQPACPTPAREAVRTAPPIGDPDTSSRTVALTFDDGPGPATPQVLDVLKQAGVPATFFVVGENAVGNPEMLRRIIADGHALGDHTWSHDIPNAAAGWNRKKLAGEIRRTHRAITDATGVQPCLFRPPGGIVKGAESVARAARLSMILWSVDTRDWAGASKGGSKFADVIRKRAALGLTQEHPVILLHDGGGDRAATVLALPEIINDYRAQGYRFVTLDQSS